MPFSQTAVSSLNDLTSQLAAFATANAGFTNHGSIVLAAGDFSPAGGETMQRISKGGMYWSFLAVSAPAEQTDKNYIVGFMSLSLPAQYPATVVSTSARTYGGPNADSRMSAWNFSGPYTGLHMFTEGTCVHAVVELSSNIFNHISFGMITKTDTFTGGEYLSMGGYAANSSNGLGGYNLRSVDDSSNSSMWFGSPLITSASLPLFTQYGAISKNYIHHKGPTTYNDRRDFAVFAGVEQNQSAAGCTRGYIFDALLRDSPNAANLRTTMFPQHIFIKDLVSQVYKFSGYVPDVRIVSVENLTEKEIIYTDWQVFPLTQKNGDNIFASNSKKLGLAYRRVA